MNAHAKTAHNALPQTEAATSQLPILHAIGGQALTQRAEWLKPDPPFFPHLSNLSRVFPVVDAFRTEFHGYVDAALEHLFQLRPSLRTMAPASCWRLALNAQRYGAIYFLGRRDAALALEAAGEFDVQLDAIGQELSTDGLSNRLFNFAVCAWVHGRADRRRYSRIRLPRNGLMTQERDAVFVNRKNFEGFSPEMAFDCGQALYDLHDFVHYLCACISPQLYGCKYFGAFSQLERELQALIRDHRHQDETPTLFGDSLMFRQLSLGLFDTLQHRTDSDRHLVEAISVELARYLRAEIALLQPATGRMVSAPHSLDPRSLAALSQNKAYEHTASECEELVFVRGAPSGADALSAHGTAQRIQLMSRLPMQYHERRNYLRHRAHKRAYLLHARHLRNACADATPDARMLDIVINNLTFADYLAGSRLDLFEHL